VGPKKSLERFGARAGEVLRKHYFAGHWRASGSGSFTFQKISHIVESQVRGENIGGLNQRKKMENISPDGEGGGSEAITDTGSLPGKIMLSISIHTEKGSGGLFKTREFHKRAETSLGQQKKGKGWDLAILFG